MSSVVVLHLLLFQMRSHARRQMGAIWTLIGQVGTYCGALMGVHQDMQRLLEACIFDCQDGGAARCGLMLGEADLIMLP